MKCYAKFKNGYSGSLKEDNSRHYKPKYNPKDFWPFLPETSPSSGL